LTNHSRRNPLNYIKIKNEVFALDFLSNFSQDLHHVLTSTLNKDFQTFSHDWNNCFNPGTEIFQYGIYGFSHVYRVLNP